MDDFLITFTLTTEDIEIALSDLATQAYINNSDPITVIHPNDATSGDTGFLICNTTVTFVKMHMTKTPDKYFRYKILQFVAFNPFFREGPMSEVGIKERCCFIKFSSYPTRTVLHMKEQIKQILDNAIKEKLSNLYDSNKPRKPSL